MINLTVFAQVAERGKCRGDKNQQFVYPKVSSLLVVRKFLSSDFKYSIQSPLEDFSPET